MFVFVLKPKVLTLVLLELPGLLFFTTYTLSVLFWAEIYYQANNLPTARLGAWYLSINGVIYVIQVLIWIYLWINPNSFVESMSQVFIAVVSVVAAVGFLMYGGGLFLLLRHFPIESKGRRKKLHEVGWVTAICFTCFLIRCFMCPPLMLVHLLQFWISFTIRWLRYFPLHACSLYSTEATSKENIESVPTDSLRSS